MKFKEQLIARLNQAEQERGNLTVLFTNSISEKVGLSATEFECLDIISNNQPITAGQLASLVGLSTGGITGVVDRLEQGGFVRRRRDTADRRRVLLEKLPNKDITRKIRALYEPLGQRFDQICRELTSAELETILRYETRTITMVRELLGHPEDSTHRPH